MSKTKTARPVFPPGTAARLPGVPEPYAHGHVPRHGLGWTPGKGYHALSAKHAHLAGAYEDGMFTDTHHGYGDGPDAPHHTLEEHESNVRHTVAFPPELADPIGKLQKSAADLAKFKPDIGKGFSIFNATPDSGKAIDFFSDGTVRGAVDLGGVSRVFREQFRALPGAAEVRHRLFGALRDADEDYLDMPTANYDVFASFDAETYAALLLVLARRHGSYHVAPGDPGFVSNGVLYMNGPEGEIMLHMNVAPVALEQSAPGLDDSSAAIAITRVFRAVGENIFYTDAITPATTRIRRDDDRHASDIDFEVHTSLDMAHRDYVKGRIVFH